MAYTLSNLLEDGFQRVKYWRYGTATAGSTTTITDTSENFTNATAYKGGIALITRADSAAPEREFAEISSYASQIFTFTALTAAVASGDRYAVAQRYADFEETIALMNDALKMFEIATTDSSLTSASDQTEYNLPVGLKRHELLRVEYQGTTSDSNDNLWEKIYDWGQVPSAPASVGTLNIPQIPSGRTIRLWYIGEHPSVNAYGDTISEFIHPILARAAFVERLRNRQNEEALSGAPQIRRTYDKAYAELQEAIQQYPIWLPQRRSRVLQVEWNG